MIAFIYTVARRVHLCMCGNSKNVLYVSIIILPLEYIFPSVGQSCLLMRRRLDWRWLCVWRRCAASCAAVGVDTLVRNIFNGIFNGIFGAMVNTTVQLMCMLRLQGRNLGLQALARLIQRAFVINPSCLRAFLPSPSTNVVDTREFPE